MDQSAKCCQSIPLQIDAETRKVQKRRQAGVKAGNACFKIAWPATNFIQMGQILSIILSTSLDKFLTFEKVKNFEMVWYNSLQSTFSGF